MKVNYKALRRKTRKLFIEYEKAKIEGDEDRQMLISNQIVELNIPIVNFILRKFVNRGENIDDIRQAGCIGLIKAVERYDLGRGFEFSTFAAPTIEGEIKRYFRDTVPVVKISRTLKETRAKVFCVIGSLTIKLGHEPSVEDLSRELGISLPKIISALNLPSEVVISLDTPLDDSEGSSSIVDLISYKDPSMEIVDNLDELRIAFECLTEFELKIIKMRFWNEMTQSEVADALGISQMHVSRTIKKSLDKMRQYVYKGTRVIRNAQTVLKNSNKKGQESHRVSSFGVIVPAQPKDIKSLNIPSSLLRFRKACSKDDFELDELCDFMWSCGATISKDILLSFSGKFIFPSRVKGLWRFEPDSSPVFAGDILAYLVSNLEKMTYKKEVLA